MRAKTIILLFAVLGLAACDDGGGVSYIPPTAPAGRLCLMQCEKARGYCAESCDLDFRACYAAMQQRAQQAYASYARQAHDAGLQQTQTPAAFENRAACDPAKNTCIAACTGDYNSCFTICGGTVSPL